MNRPFRLQQLGFPGMFVDLGLGDPVFGWRRLLAPRGAPHRCDYREQGFRYDPAIVVEAGDCMYGHFQSWKYLEPVKKPLRQEFARLRGERLAVLTPVAALIAQPGAIVVHVRRGDYVQAPTRRFHGLVDFSFYQIAVQSLRQQGFDGPLVIFSDDIDAAVAELTPLGGVLAGSGQGLTDEVDELLVMSEASALVTANSSFSWWSAWIGDRPGRPVITPEPWFDDTTVDAMDLVPPHWTATRRPTPEV